MSFATIGFDDYYASATKNQIPPKCHTQVPPKRAPLRETINKRRCPVGRSQS